VRDILTIYGGKPLNGEVAVRGAKNSLPKCMVAALLTGERCVLRNVANIEDVEIVSGMISSLGGSVNEVTPGVLEILTANIRPVGKKELDVFAGKSRIPILFCGPLLARFGSAFIPKLGGCNIGPRPINFHLEALRKLGAKVEKSRAGTRLSAEKLAGAVIDLPYPSVGATEQVLFSSVLAEGVTELRGAALEPEIIDLVALLQKMGAIITVLPDRVIKITGVNRLTGFDHEVMPDRLEVASWASAALATHGDIFVRGARQGDVATFLNKFRQVGGEFEVKKEGIRFRRALDKLLPITIETEVHPGFMTDWQQPFVVALTQADGTSIVHETVYEDRFGYVTALNSMGAKIELLRECLGSTHFRIGRKNHLHSAVITGPTPLQGRDITVPDLRGGFSYIIAALVAKGVSNISNIGIISRGYEQVVDKLRALGADTRAG
jgi:UDP-N-acetylglucosamine 1-carboxyvinyltransferase